MQVFLAAAEAMRAGRPAALVTVTAIQGSAPRRPGARMVVHADGSVVGTVGGGAWEHRLVREALEAIGEGRPRRVASHLGLDLGMCCGGAMEAFIEPLLPRETLVIHGAGHVGRAVARMAPDLDFAVIVVDDRPDQLALLGEIPGVERREADPRRVLDALPRGPHAYHLVVTHDHQLDQDIVERLLPADLAWLGLIASRSKVAKFLLRYRAAGMDPALFRRLSAPVGLDIGAETPAEIALSILAEVVRVRRRRGSPGSRGGGAGR